MAKFFVERPIVAIVISILMVLLGSSHGRSCPSRSTRISRRPRSSFRPRTSAPTR
jgi:hypothetical protein